MREFFRPRQFEVEWDGRVRGQGSANIGVPQGSPLSPVVFLIWMAPILEKMEAKLREEVGLDIEVPSFVDDICMDLIDRDEGSGINM